MQIDIRTLQATTRVKTMEGVHKRLSDSFNHFSSVMSNNDSFLLKWLQKGNEQNSRKFPHGGVTQPLEDKQSIGTTAEPLAGTQIYILHDHSHLD